MHINPYLIIEDEKYLVDDFKFGFRQKPNAAGVPIEVPVFEGLHVVIRGHYPGFFLERWACASNQSKLVELVLKPLVLGSGPTPVFTFFDAHLVDFTKNYSEKKNPPVEMILKITAGGVRDSFSKSEYAAPWRETFEKPSAVVLTPPESESPEPNPRITNSWWSKDRFGKQKIDSAKLGETVYFILETADIANGAQITLQLFEQDKNIFMRDFLDPDDDEFPDKPVIHKAVVLQNQAVISLKLSQSWEPMLVDDSDNAFSLDKQLELYWKASYKQLAETLPRTDNAYLKVSFSNRTLYFKTPTPNHKLPEFISYDGDPLLLMSFGKSVVNDKIKNEILDAATQKAEKAIQSIVFAKLSKANLIDANGNMQQGAQLIESYKALYDRPNELFKNRKAGKGARYGQKYRSCLGYF